MVDQNKDKIITPLKVEVKKEKAVRFGAKRKNYLRLALLSLSLVIMIVGGLWLFSYLSRNPVRTVSVPVEKVTPEPQSKELPAEIPSSQMQEDVDKVQIAKEKKEAEQKLSDFLQVKKVLDAKGVAEWGGKLYDRMIQLSQAADAFFIHEEFVSASEKYAEAIETLNKLGDGTDDALRRILNEGQMALKEGNGDRSQHLFSVALMIDPGNTFALHSLERAKNIETVMRLIASGEKHEEENNLSFAHADYQEAVRLDPESEKAKSALIRVKSIISAEEFQQLMSSGFKAFNSNDYNRARSLFLKAQSFKPDSHEVNDALAQVDTSIRLSHIEDLRKKALAAEDAENWEKSLASYQAVLKIDSSIQFAIQGKERSTKRSQLEKRMNDYLEKPNVLESDHNLKKAIELVKKAEKIESKGPRFNEQLKRLDELVKSAQIPVQVTLESDGVTEVVIYKVGKFGRFYIRELNLRPGTYTIVGARDGFKDVRQKISVKTGQGPIRIIVKCGEKI